MGKVTLNNEFISKYAEPNVINFPDKNFEKAVRKEIKKSKGDILYSDISEIDKIEFANKGNKIN